MGARLTSLSTVQLARLFGRVRSVEAVALPIVGPWKWCLAIHGRGIDWTLRHEMLDGDSLLRAASAYRPRPHVFTSRQSAEAFAHDVGLSAFLVRSHV